jgi:hypothetical protein
MKVYTSYYGKLRLIDTKIYEPIAISLTVPNSVSLINCRKLNPNPEDFHRYKQTGNWSVFREAYQTKLDRYSQRDIEDSLIYLSKGKIPVLLCWEKECECCHRSIIAEWLNKVGIQCEELK